MRITRQIILFYFLLQAANLKAQNNKPDSTKVAGTLTELLKICAKVDFSDPKVQQLGTFYKAAPYIVYMGENKKRKWKDFANYTNKEEKTQVDEICFRINNSVNQDSNYKFIKYLKQTESEGVWHVIIVSYNRKGKNKQAAFAFLKIRERFALGDID